MNKRLILIDGHALFHRAFHALPPFRSPKGEVVNAIYGFLSILLRTIKDVNPDYIVATFDLATKTFRHEEFEEYKAHREAAPDEMHDQLPRLKEVLESFGIPIYEAEVVSSGNDEEDKIANLKAEEDLRKKFQGIVRNFLRAEKNPATQLAFLNKIQKQTKHHLFNIDGSHKGTRSTKGSSAFNSLKYGYADLLRFLCEPVKSGEVARMTRANPTGHRFVVDNINGQYIRTADGKYLKVDGPQQTDAKARYRREATNNPFYQPIQYDVPDERGNELLEKLYVGARQYYAKKVAELAYLKKELSTKPSKERRKSLLENMLLIFRQIHDNRFDPIHLSKQIKGQQRPMETYKNEHFYELLEQLSTRKRLAPASIRERPPKGNTGISLTNPVLDHVQRKTTKHHKRRKSKSNGHSSSSE